MHDRIDLAPPEVLVGALRVLHVAAYTSRNHTLRETVPRAQVNALWEALHEIPDLLRRWRADAEVELLGYLDAYGRGFDDLRLRIMYEQARDAARAATQA